MIPGSGRSPGEGNDNPLQYSCLENPHGQRSLVGYSPWGCKESDTTERLSARAHTHTHTHTLSLSLSLSLSKIYELRTYRSKAGLLFIKKKEKGGLGYYPR